jgi:hypothetical protein
MMVRASLLLEIVPIITGAKKKSDGECIPFHIFLPPAWFEQITQM